MVAKPALQNQGGETETEKRQRQRQRPQVGCERMSELSE